MKLFIVSLILILGDTICAQKPEKFACSQADVVTVKQYFNDRRENDKLLSDLFSTFDALKPRLPFCWSGCVVRLPKPYYPDFARKYGLFGTIRVETIADEAGNIIYAKAVSGPLVFRHTAQQAACHSSFTSIVLSGKPIKFRWNIVYNFVP
jgi:hypothetical protein